MPVIRGIQTNFTSGVLDPLLAEREDIRFYYNGLEEGENIEVIPQGGVRRRRGRRILRKLAKTFSAISLVSATVTAPNGGTTGNVKDGDDSTVLETTSNLGTTNPFVIAHIDLGSSQQIDRIDILNYKLTTGTLNDEIFVQTSADNSAWTNYGSAFNWGSSNRSRRIRGNAAARYVRVARIGATNIAAHAFIGEIKLWQESNTLSNARMFPFARSGDDAYMMVATDGNADILKGDETVAAMALPYAQADLPIVNYMQSLDTILFFHPDHQPRRGFRQGSDDEFDFRKQDFENIPNYDYGAGTGGVNEIQRLSYSVLATNDEFNLLLEGERTIRIVMNATPATTATDIQTALRNLSNTSASGITVAHDSSNAAFLVTFGGDDGKRTWEEIKVSVMKGNSIWTTGYDTRGEPEGEAIMSDTRGWPRCGTIHQQRLVVGGFKSKPDAWMASKIAQYYNFKTGDADDAAILTAPADADQVAEIYQIVVGRHLTFFTSDGEYYIPNEALAKDAVLKFTTDAGIKEGLRVFRVEGALLFIQDGGASVREFLFVDTEQNYQANNISLLSSHLIKNPVDAWLRKGTQTNEPDTLYLVNEDGTIAHLTTLRSQNITAFTKHTISNGDNLAVSVDKNRNVYFITERVINGVKERYIEIQDNDMILDGGKVTVTAEEFVLATDETEDEFTWTFDNPLSADAIGVRVDGGRLEPEEYSVDLGTKTVTLAVPVTGKIVRVARMINEISGVGHLEGATMKIRFDGSPATDAVISGGVMSFDKYADTSIEYGFDFTVYGKIMRPRMELPNGTSADKFKRILGLIASVFQTGDLSLGANGGRMRSIDLLQFDSEILDRSNDELLVTGNVRMNAILGYSRDGQIEFGQQAPAPFLLRSLIWDIKI